MWAFIWQWGLWEVIWRCDQLNQQHLHQIRFWYSYRPWELWQSMSHARGVVTDFTQLKFKPEFTTYLLFELSGDPDRRCVWKSRLPDLSLWRFWKEFQPPETALCPLHADLIQSWKFQCIDDPQWQGKQWICHRYVLFPILICCVSDLDL